MPAVFGLLCFGCGSQSGGPAAEEPTPAPTVEIKEKVFEDDLGSVRYNDYTYIFVLRRKDGAALNGEDGNFIRINTPGETNQRRMSDNGKALIIGTNFRFYPDQWDALNKRFDLQDLSAEKYQKNEGDTEAEDAPPPPKKTTKR
jgi:hypothetical protein